MMKILWITNTELPRAARHFGRKMHYCGWLDQSSTLLSRRDDIELHVLSFGSDYAEVKLDEAYYGGFVTSSGLARIQVAYTDIDPDVIHIWGTEYPHAFSAVKMACDMMLEDRIVISIQGLITYALEHFYHGLPHKYTYKRTLYEFIRHAGIRDVYKNWIRLSSNEKQIFKTIRYCIGRTEWDKACSRQLNPSVKYFDCNEVLREAFYSNMWDYSKCESHMIAFSQTYAPLKGLHRLVEAVAIVRQFYPDVKVRVPMNSPYRYAGIPEWIKRNSYMVYIAHLIKKLHLKECFDWCGGLSESEMVSHYLRSNVYVCASSIENSSNSVCEAMMLGMPIVASDVGGMKSLIRHEREGLLYQSDAPYMLADCIMRIFDDTDAAIEMGRCAHERAEMIHDRQENTDRMISIYKYIADCAMHEKI